jgi:hypothetical protein
MKVFFWLKTSLFLTAAVFATTAKAQFVGQFNLPSPTNAAPVVRIISPEEGAVFLPGDPIQIVADVDHFTNRVVGVEFWAGTNSLGMVTNSLWHSDVFLLTVTNLAAGDYTLAAVATDSAGNSATSAGVDISVVTNLPPKVRLVAPRDGAVILGPTNIALAAAAYDPDGTVASVEFFAGTNSLGLVSNPPPVIVTNHFGVFPVKQPFTLTWSNAPAGAYILTAVATDNEGATATSAPVNITVVTDLPPVVHLVLPENGSRYLAPADISLSAAASASDPDGTVASVQFFAGATSLGVVTAPVVVTNLWHVTSLYSLTWSNAPAGAYALTAVATDNAGMTATSAPVNITVLPPPQPKVAIATPENGETFHNAPVNIDLCALERYFTNPVVQIQFFAGSSAVGVTTNSPYGCVIWTNVLAGAYTLTAVATDSQSVNATSAPVSITVTTNRTPSWYWGH